MNGECYGGTPKLLDAKFKIYRYKSCETLCKHEEERGCCYLKVGSGCWWVSGGRVNKRVPGMAVDCDLNSICFY